MSILHLDCDTKQYNNPDKINNLTSSYIFSCYSCVTKELFLTNDVSSKNFIFKYAAKLDINYTIH